MGKSAFTWVTSFIITNNLLFLFKLSSYNEQTQINWVFKLPKPIQKLDTLFENLFSLWESWPDEPTQLMGATTTGQKMGPAIRLRCWEDALKEAFDLHLKGAECQWSEVSGEG